MSTIKKTTCEKYTIRLPDLMGWAKITLSEEDGMVSIVSDYGNWGYLWSNHGCKSLKHFLIGIGKHYAWEKFTGCKNKFNLEKTVSHIKDYLDENVKSHDLASYNQCVEFLETLDGYNESDFLYELNDSCLLEWIEEPWYFICSDPDPQFMMFWDRLWKVFVEYLKKKLRHDF